MARRRLEGERAVTWARRSVDLAVGTAAVWAVACTALVLIYGPPDADTSMVIGVGSLADIVFIIIVRTLRP